MNIVLLEPEIPQNTGNIARTCAAIGAKLHLIGPMGFKIEDKYVKRAGLDYWGEVDLVYYNNYLEFIAKNENKTFYFATTKAKYNYSEIKYKKDDYIFFGKETAGIPEEILYNNKEYCIRIPMRNTIRSLNLSNSVAIIAYEAFRQFEFKGLCEEGSLTKYNWED